jgi:C4-dicarboxylate-specific signal transduction histidine kinase
MAKETLSRKEALEKRAAQIAAQLKALQAKEADKARKSDTRRKVIAGALALEHMKRNAGSDFAKVMHGLLHSEVEREQDRALFDLTGKAPKKANTEGQKAAAE